MITKWGAVLFGVSSLCTLLTVGCVQGGDDDAGGGTPPPGDPGGGGGNAADCALGTWTLVMTLTDGDCFGSFTHELTGTYVIAGGNGSYTVADEDGDDVTLELAYSLGDSCHAELTEDIGGGDLFGAYELDADASGHITGTGRFLGHNGCVHNFTASGSKQ